MPTDFLNGRLKRKDFAFDHNTSIFLFVFIFFSHRMLLSALFVGNRKNDKEIPSLLYNVTPRNFSLDRKSSYLVLLPIYLWLLQFIPHQHRQRRR